jgi:hypothetical protein
MCWEQVLGLICLIPALIYFLVYEINWEAVKELISRKAK